MIVAFTERGWKHYLHWQTPDKSILRKINALISHSQRHPYEGIGKPEPLKNDLSGFWSRRIDREHRLVYRVRDGELEIVQCRYYY